MECLAESDRILSCDGRVDSSGWSLFWRRSQTIRLDSTSVDSPLAILSRSTDNEEGELEGIDDGSTVRIEGP